MKINQIVGIAVLAVGLFLLAIAYQSTNAPMEKVSDAITGRYSEQTMWYFVIGIFLAFGGGLMAVFGSRK